MLSNILLVLRYHGNKNWADIQCNDNTARHHTFFTHSHTDKELNMHFFCLVLWLLFKSPCSDSQYKCCVLKSGWTCNSFTQRFCVIKGTTYSILTAVNGASESLEFKHLILKHWTLSMSDRMCEIFSLYALEKWPKTSTDDPGSLYWDRQVLVLYIRNRTKSSYDEEKSM